MVPHNLVGHLFLGRYKDILCNRDCYLLELVRYIHLSPVRSKIVTDPADYAWSSHRDYLNSGTAKAEAMVQSEWILEQFAPNLAGRGTIMRSSCWTVLERGTAMIFMMSKSKEF